MQISDAGKAVALDALGAVALFAAVHEDSSPGENGTGTAEIGSRQAITWDSAALGELDASNQPAFSIPGSTTVGGFSLWGSASLGTCYGGVGVTPEVFASPGTYTLTEVTVELVPAA